MKPDRLRKNFCGCGFPAREDRPEQLISRRAIVAVSATAILAKGSGFPASAGAAAAEPEPIVQPRTPGDAAFIARAFEMRQRGIELGDRAYGAVVVRAGEIVGQSWSRVVLDVDPTAHAEMAAIRDAARRTGNANLGGTVMYSSSRPCPMGEAAAYWAGIDELVWGREVTRSGPPVLCR